MLHRLSLFSAMAAVAVTEAAAASGPVLAVAKAQEEEAGEECGGLPHCGSLALAATKASAQVGGRFQLYRDILLKQGLT